MPSDIQTVADPGLILLAWAAGLSLAAGAIVFSRIVGPGFTWLAAGTAAVIGLAGVFDDDAWWARSGLVLLLLALFWARNSGVSGALLTLAGIAYLVEAALVSGPLAAVTAALAFGGVTGEMMLGHWYLVDPRLPRGALRDLAVAGIVGLLSEAALLTYLDIGFAGGALGFWLLLLTSVLLMAAVVASLRHPAYSGVMSATGLSYLALLTTLGAVFVGRAVVAGLGPFAL